ncbi:MarC family protein [Allokutzneria sp. NRRL B-24872]|uniref:MarC family protein n=1 Tax=Allokutzneria sp. NRRL B-24872 TaxID=1137961 RepID=UPI000A367796|nr:MarC family protein [Allokutzneria sp. NRRL B-24872]
MTFVEAFSILIAVVGPPKILLAFVSDTEHVDARRRWRVALTTTAIALATGLFVIVAGRLLIQVFHISGGALMLASGVILFVHALDLVLDRGNHHAHVDRTGGTHELATAYYANPVAVAYLFLMADASTLPSSLSLAGAYVAVIGLDLVAILVLGILLRYVKTTYTWVLVRVLGVLLAALGVDLIITGLEQLHIIGSVD